MVTGAGLTGLDSLGSGWLVIRALAPRTEATVTITNCGPDRFQSPSTFRSRRRSHPTQEECP